MSNVKKKEKKKMGTARKVIIIICCVILALALIGFGLYAWQIHTANTLRDSTIDNFVQMLPEISTDTDADADADDGTPDYLKDLELQTINWDGLRQEGKDVVAWIQVPAIPTINYPVVHYTDNDYYLRRSYTGEYLISGCIFEDCNCAPDFSDLHTIVYGHNMSSGIMFGQLKNFRDSSFYFNNDDRVVIYTPEKILIYEIFSVHVQDKNTPGIYMVNFERNSYWDDFVAKLKGLSEFDTGIDVSGNDKVLTLSTCSGVSGTSNRLNLNCKLEAEVYINSGGGDDESAETQTQT